MKRDLTKDQFEYRATKLGFVKGGFMGYWTLTDGATSVSVWNAGKRRRDQLNYLIRKDKENNQRAIDKARGSSSAIRVEAEGE